MSNTLAHLENIGEIILMHFENIGKNTINSIYEENNYIVRTGVECALCGGQPKLSQSNIDEVLKAMESAPEL